MKQIILGILLLLTAVLFLVTVMQMNVDHVTFYQALIESLKIGGVIVVFLALTGTGISIISKQVNK